MNVADLIYGLIVSKCASCGYLNEDQRELALQQEEEALANAVCGVPGLHTEHASIHNLYLVLISHC